MWSMIVVHKITNSVIVNTFSVNLDLSHRVFLKQFTSPVQKISRYILSSSGCGLPASPKEMNKNNYTAFTYSIMQFSTVKIIRTNGNKRRWNPNKREGEIDKIKEAVHVCNFNFVFLVRFKWKREGSKKVTYQQSISKREKWDMAKRFLSSQMLKQKWCDVGMVTFSNRTPIIIADAMHAFGYENVNLMSHDR